MSCCSPSRSAGRRPPGGDSCRARCTWRRGRIRWRPARPAAWPSSGRGRTSPAYEAARRERPGITAGLLAIEGAHALDDDPANVEVVADAGFRMMSPSHFFDNAFGGSAHGIAKGGLTEAGREMVRRMEARGMLVDVSHASAATIDDVVAMADASGRVLAHRRPRRRRQRPQPDRRAAPRDRRDRRAGRHRVLADRLRRRGRRLRSRARSSTPSTSPASSTSRSAPTSMGPSPSRSTRPGWSC